MIGTSDGEQFDTQFEHAVAQHGAPKPLGPPQTQRDPMGSVPEPSFKERYGFNPEDNIPYLDYVDPKGKFDDSPTDTSKVDKTVDEILGHQSELETKGAIHPDRFLEDLGINMPKSDLGFRPGDVQGDRLDRNPDYGAQQQRQFHPDSIRKDINLAPNVKSVLSQPHVAEAIANPKIDRTHDVPYEAGASAKPDDFTTHIDKSIPSSVTISGKTFDPAIPANIHEQVEREVMTNLIKKGMSNEKAYEIAHHEYAEPAEDAWYQAHGIDVGEVNKQWAKWDKGTEQETAKDKDFPKDLYKKPYAHNKVEGMKHEPSGVNQVWAMNDKFTPLNPMTPQYSNPGGHAKGNTPESIYSAAIKHQDGSIHMGDNHGEAYRNSQKETGVRPIYTENGQGFITSTGRYVSRHEAVPIAEAAGQVVPTSKLDKLGRKTREEFGLTSEDVEMGPSPTHDEHGFLTSHGRKYYDEDSSK